MHAATVRNLKTANAAKAIPTSGRAWCDHNLLQLFSSCRLHEPQVKTSTLVKSCFDGGKCLPRYFAHAGFRSGTVNPHSSDKSYRITEIHGVDRARGPKSSMYLALLLATVNVATTTAAVE